MLAAGGCECSKTVYSWQPNGICLRLLYHGGSGRRDCRETIKELYLNLFETGRAMMKYSTQIKPIRYLKANAAEIMRELSEQRRPLVIAKNG